MDIWDQIDTLLDSSSTPVPHPVQPTVPTTVNRSSNELIKKPEEPKLKITITRAGTRIDLKKLDSMIINRIKNYLTIRDITIMGYEKKTPCFLHERDSLYVPRFGAFLLKNKFSNVKITNTISCDNPIDMKYNGEEPTFIQQLILDELNNKWLNTSRIKAGRGGVIINLQAGYGKTYLAMKLISQLQLRTLIVVHNKTILKQWKDLLIAKFPNNSINSYFSDNKGFGDIVVGVINSLISSEIKGFSTPREFYDKFDVVILDECHEYCSAGRSKFFDVCQCPYMIGLSATPEERNDNLSKVIKWNIGPILEADKLEGYTTEDIPFKGNVVEVRYSGPHKFTKSIVNKKLETVSATKMIEQFCLDPDRTKLIAELTMEFYKKNYNIFVFADRRDYLETINIYINRLHLQCQMLTNDKELESIRLVGGSKETEMRDAKENKRIILTTYSYMGTGCSIPKMDCIILATPRRSKSRQIINRIFRLHSDYSIVRQIVDIVDWKTTLKNQYYERAKYYKSQNFTKEVRSITIPD